MHLEAGTFGTKCARNCHYRFQLFFELLMIKTGDVFETLVFSGLV